MSIVHNQPSCRHLALSNLCVKIVKGLRELCFAIHTRVDKVFNIHAVMEGCITKKRAQTGWVDGDGCSAFSWDSVGMGERGIVLNFVVGSQAVQIKTKEPVATKKNADNG